MRSWRTRPIGYLSALGVVAFASVALMAVAASQDTQREPAPSEDLDPASSDPGPCGELAQALRTSDIRTAESMLAVSQLSLSLPGSLRDSVRGYTCAARGAEIVQFGILLSPAQGSTGAVLEFVHPDRLDEVIEQHQLAYADAALNPGSGDVQIAAVGPSTIWLGHDGRRIEELPDLGADTLSAEEILTAIGEATKG